MNYEQKINDTKIKFKERITRYQKKLSDDEKKLAEYLIEFKDREKKGKSTKGIEKRIESKKRVIRNGKIRIRETRKKMKDRLETLDKLMKKRMEKDEELIEKNELTIEAKKLCRDYNLNTALKSYIDPRIYYVWGKKIDYDWKNYYSKSLQSKFSWIENNTF